jgi:hypothetical protein
MAEFFVYGLSSRLKDSKRLGGIYIKQVILLYRITDRRITI